MAEVKINAFGRRANGTPLDAILAVVVDKDGNPISAGSGGEVEALLPSLGAPSDPLWNGTSPNPTIVSILKAIHEQNEALKRIGNETNTLLVQISEHTRPVPSGT